MAKVSAGHLGPVLLILLGVAVPLGIIGIIGLASTMSANVLDRIREFGVPPAKGSGSNVGSTHCSKLQPLSKSIMAEVSRRTFGLLLTGPHPAGNPGRRRHRRRVGTAFSRLGDYLSDRSPRLTSDSLVRQPYFVTWPVALRSQGYTSIHSVSCCDIW
jgi:hypothetical protein